MATRAFLTVSMDRELLPAQARVGGAETEIETEQLGPHQMARWILTVLLMAVAYQVR